MAATAPFPGDDIEPEETIAIAIADHRDAGDGLIVDEAHQEPGRIGNVEIGGIAPAGVPAFGSGPLHCEVQIGPRHYPDRQIRRHGRPYTPFPASDPCSPRARRTMNTVPSASTRKKKEKPQ